MQFSLLIQVGWIRLEGDLDFDVSGLANWRSNCTLEVNFNLFCDEISCQFWSTTHFQQIKRNYPWSIVWFQPFEQKRWNQNRSLIIAYSLLGGVACRWYCWGGENQLEVYCRGNTPPMIAIIPPWFPFFAGFIRGHSGLTNILLLISPISECTCLKQLHFIISPLSNDLADLARPRVQLSKLLFLQIWIVHFLIRLNAPLKSGEGHDDYDDVFAKSALESGRSWCQKSRQLILHELG